METKGSSMNRLYNLLTVMVLTVGALLAAPEALAKVLTGTGGEDRLIGTDRIDRLTGLAGEDNLKGRAGDDRIWGGQGNDKIIPGEGNDKVYAGYGDDLIYARHRGGGFYRLRARLRQGRDHTPRRRDPQ